jgi:hypothetical protein
VVVAQAPSPQLWAAISVNEPVFIEGHVETLQIYFSVVNDGTTVANPEVRLSHLYINGVEPQDWTWVISNGPRSEYFWALPPGQVLTFTYGLGRYITTPGIYKVSWSGPGYKTSEITLRVIPDPKKK